MKWIFTNTGFNTGKFNMEYDLALAGSCAQDEAYFRLYRWEPYCISLGAGQDIKEIDLDKTKSAGLDVVKRPTGGRAILHAEEITYSVVYPLKWDLSPKEIYNKISQALVNGLVKYNEKLKPLELENIQPNFPALLKESSGSLCFASTAKNEVKYLGKKLIGSAQRRLLNVVLQHGSILCGGYHRNLPLYLNCSDEEIEKLKLILDEKTIELDSILGEPVNYKKLEDSLIAGFLETWNTEFEILHNQEIII